MSGLEEILAKEQSIKDQLADPLVTRIDFPRAFFRQQVGIEEALIGPDDRIWVQRGFELHLVFDKRWLTR